MAEFTMPSLGADMDEGVLAQWLVKPGDVVERGQIVAVVETHKGAIDVEIFSGGTILELLVPEDSTVPVGAVLALYVAEGETEAEVRAKASAPASASSVTSASSPAPTLAPASESESEPEPEPEPAPARARVSPRARRLARELGVELDQVDASGPGGTVTGDDVRAAAQSGERARPRRPGKLDKAAMRQAIGAAMSRSKAQIPHYYLAHTVDLEPALTWLEAHNAGVGVAERVLPVTLWVRALARALVEHPQLNGYWREGAFVPGAGVHVGLAVALRGGGLVNPALRDADQGSLVELGARLRELSARARTNALRASELNAATVTLSSLGDRGVDLVIPIIEPPQVAIVGFGTPRLRPWIVDGAVVPRRVADISLAADHRASDGHTGARFLQTLAKLLAQPPAEPEQP